MPTLLFEIGCEELPARACVEAEAQLRDLVESRLVGWGPFSYYIGPRRLAFTAANVPEIWPGEMVIGPPVRVAFDDNGQPTRAAEAFAEKHNRLVSEIETYEGSDPRAQGRIIIQKEDAPAEAILALTLAGILGDLKFGKSMRWAGDKRFSRPVRWLCGLHGDQPVKYVSLDDLRIGPASWGHRFTHGKVEVSSADSYLKTLRTVDVEPDHAERRSRIVEGLDALGEWSDPAGKLDEVVHLAEWPTVVRAEFPERFLDLPERVIVTTMQSHQRYFPLGGNAFAVVLNGGDPGVARQGHEQVLEARLQDAAFTFERDVAKGIEGLFGQLPSITFMGDSTYSEKQARMGTIALKLQGDADSLLASRLAKADQAAELVREFPDLEGYIGAVYARLAGHPEQVAIAIEDHYLPDGADAPLPRTRAGMVVSAADKIDNLEENFRRGSRPTGSRDPFGLRRAAIGLNRIADEGGLEIPRDLLPLSGEFVEERLEGLVDVPVEFVRAARASAVADLGAVARRARDLHAARDSDDFDRAFTVYDRARSIAGKHEGGDELDRTLMEPAETALADALAGLDLTGSFPDALASAARLADPMERFFTDVLVMDPDEAKRSNRLTLLRRIQLTVGQLGDFSQIPR